MFSSDSPSRAFVLVETTPEFTMGPAQLQDVDWATGCDLFQPPHAQVLPSEISLDDTMALLVTPFEAVWPLMP
jgi:hypothetical protein